MSAFLGTLAVGVICIILGISNARGNISTLHSYHRKRVSEENKLPFGKTVGIGTIIIGASLVIHGVLSGLAFYTENGSYTLAGTVIMIAGFVIGIGIAFYAMIKYNKGIF